jgi:PKD repeat protein
VHTYSAAGQYTATVTVRDENGDTATDTISIDVGDNLIPSANASATPATGRAPLPVDFFANATGGNGTLTYAWDFGDGNTSTDQNPSHTFNTPGTYNVSLIVTDGDGSTDGSSVTVEVLDDAQPTVSASATPDTGIAPINIQFDATVSAGDAPFTYSWDFGDSSATQTGPRPNHSYTSGGTYTATVTVTDADGDTTSDTVDVTIADDEVPAVTVTADQDTGTAPHTVNFTTSATGGNAPLSYTWYFGDGSAPGSGDTITHTYQNAGVYEATVVVTDANGDTARDTVTINARANAPDLTIESFTAARTGNDVDFTIVLRNDGTADLVHPFDVRLYYDEAQAPTASTQSNHSERVYDVIPPGGTYTVTFTAFDRNIGSYDAYVFADPRQESADLDRSNNISGPETFIIDGLHISEVLYDTVSTDDPDQTFIELFGPAGKDLSGYELSAINGTDGTSYDTITLAQGTTIPANGYLVISSANHPEVDVVANANLQNGPDSLEVRDPQGGLVDALGYGDFAGAGLLANFFGEGSAARDPGPGVSLGRSTDQSDTDDNSVDFYSWAQPTPGAENNVTLSNNADTCADAYDLTAGGQGRFYVEGNLGSATNTFTTRSTSGTQGYCFSTSNTFSGPDQIFAITVPTGETADVTFSLSDNANVDVDAVITADPCTSLDTGMIGCNPVGTEYFTLTEGTYYLVVMEDGGNNLSSSNEPYSISLDVTFQ